MSLSVYIQFHLTYVYPYANTTVFTSVFVSFSIRKYEFSNTVPFQECWQIQGSCNSNFKRHLLMSTKQSAGLPIGIESVYPPGQYCHLNHTVFHLFILFSFLKHSQVGSQRGNQQQRLPTVLLLQPSTACNSTCYGTNPAWLLLLLMHETQRSCVYCALCGDIIDTFQEVTTSTKTLPCLYIQCGYHPHLIRGEPNLVTTRCYSCWRMAPHTHVQRCIISLNACYSHSFILNILSSEVRVNPVGDSVFLNNFVIIIINQLGIKESSAQSKT